jgi:hydrogenase expression/formation protein HypE
MTPFLATVRNPTKNSARLIVSSQLIGIGKLPGELLGELLSKYPIVDPSVKDGPGVGMDAAAVDAGGDLIVVKTYPITFAKERSPHYLVNVNANDLVCLGATPRWMLVTALLPAGKTTEAEVRTLFDELQAACDSRGITLIGGHTEITTGLDRTILVGNLLGTVTPDELLKPGGARQGDRILLSRPIAIEGTALLATEMRTTLARSIDSATLDRAAGFLDEPSISVRYDAQALLKTGVVSALHDPTDGGLATGVRELATAANAGAVIGRSTVPVMHETALFASVLGLDPLGMLASGSLLASVPPSEMDVVEKACVENEIPFAWIGKIAPRDLGCILRSGSEESELPIFNTDEVARALAEASI